MPTYSYTAISPDGQTVSGTEIAEDESALRRILREKDYILTSLEKEEKKSELFSFVKNISLFQGVSLTDRLLFTRNLQVMVSAGIPLPKTLDVLSQQTKNKLFRKALLDVKSRVVKGETLSDSLEQHQTIFSELFINMIKVGEESGTMENVLTQLTLQLAQEHDLKSKVKSALVYPAIIIFAMFGIGTLMLVFVIPKLADTFESLGAELPVTTRFIIGLGTFLSEQWYIAFPLIAVVGFTFFRLLKTKLGRRTADTVVLKIPILSGMIQKANSALMTRTLSSLLGAGVPIVRALEICSRVVGNVHFQKSLRESAEEVKKGAKLSHVLKNYGSLYPLVVVQMIEVGEETGETTTILLKLAEFFEDEVSQVTKNLTSVIEPVLMLVIGAVVGFFAISMIQPMYSVLGSIE